MPKDGPTVLQFGVPMNAQGVSIVETWDTLGMRGTGSHDVVLDGVFVPDAAIAARRKPGVWHPLLHLVAMIALPTRLFGLCRHRRGGARPRRRERAPSGASRQ